MNTLVHEKIGFLSGVNNSIPVNGVVGVMWKKPVSVPYNQLGPWEDQVSVWCKQFGLHKWNGECDKEKTGSMSNMNILIHEKTGFLSGVNNSI